MTDPWSSARRTAQALHTVDDLLWGLRHHDWRVRCESVPRLVARGRQDVRTLPALLDTAVRDPSWQVRDTVVMSLVELDLGDVLPTLREAAHDLREDVRWTARFVLFQKGTGPDPGPWDVRGTGGAWCALADGELEGNGLDDDRRMPRT